MSLWKNSIDRSHGDSHRTEDNRNIKYNIPAELYNIEVGQFVLFVSKDGFDQNAAQKINDLFSYLQSLDINDAKMNAITTDNEEYLIGNIACWGPKKTDESHKVAIGSWDTVAGLIAHYSGMPVNDVVAKLSSLAEKRIVPINASKLPDVVFINPENCPVKEEQNGSDYFSYPDGGDFNGMHVTQSQNSRITESDVRARLADLLSTCDIKGYTINLGGLLEQMQEAKNKADSYYIQLDFKEKPRRKGYPRSEVFGICDIYICDDNNKTLLNIPAGQKALYLSSLLHYDGFTPSDPEFGFLEDMSIIYQRIPDAAAKDTGIKDLEQSTNNISSMRTHIKAAIMNIVPYTPVANSLAIEGARGGLFSIQKSTPELRAQIKQAFRL